MTTSEAAAALGIKPVTVRRHIDKGLIKAEKRGRDLWIEEAEVERYQQQRKGPGRPKGE